MEQPAHDLRSQLQRGAPQTAQRRFGGLIIVGLLHVAIIWALAAGLAQTLIQKLPDELKVAVEQEKTPPKTPPPPPPDLAKPPPPFVPPPEFIIQNEAPAPTAITTQSKVATPPPVAPSLTPSRIVGRTHDCQSFYPALSQRMQESGTVLVKYDVGADGVISNVRVEKSSGSERLDQAAVSCVSTKWRNTPAMEGSTPVASPDHQANVVFKLN